MSYWFYIEPYIYISSKDKKVIFYNTLNGKILEYTGIPKILKIAKKLMSNRGTYVVRLSTEDLQDQVIKSFVKKIQLYYFGDLIKKESSTTKPIQITPILNVYSDVYRLDEMKRFAFGRNVLNSLKSISFYINNQVDYEVPHLKSAYKQFLFSYSDQKEKELDIGDIKKILFDAQASSLRQINILGGNIFRYLHFDELYDFLCTLNIAKIYLVHYRDIAEPSCEIIENNKKKFLTRINDKKIQLKIFINFPIFDKQFNTAIEFVRSNKPDSEFIFIVENEKVLDDVNTIISNFSINNYVLKPYYDGKNYHFFKKFVFLSRKFFLKETINYKEIFGRMVINSNHFGNFTVFSNGSIYANPNKPRLGSLGADSLYEIIYKELSFGKSWRNLRKNVNPCKSCIYNLLCPPLSNYEYVIGKNNLCNLINQNKEI